VSSVLGLTILNELCIASISKSNLSHLQRVHRATARIVLQLEFISKAAAGKSLHWLPIHLRIQYKLALLTCKVLNTSKPLYLSSFLFLYHPARLLRSQGSFLLTQPGISNVTGSCAFRSAAPKVWHSLPVEIRSAASCLSFRSN
jgi:hypothetical protein